MKSKKVVHIAQEIMSSEKVWVAYYLTNNTSKLVYVPTFYGRMNECLFFFIRFVDVLKLLHIVSLLFNTFYINRRVFRKVIGFKDLHIVLFCHPLGCSCFEFILLCYSRAVCFFFFFIAVLEDFQRVCGQVATHGLSGQGMLWVLSLGRFSSICIYEKFILDCWAIVLLCIIILYLYLLLWYEENKVVL